MASSAKERMLGHLKEQRFQPARDQLTPQDVQDLKIVFDAFDVTNNGRIDTRDLTRALRALGFKVTKKDIIEMMTDYGLDDKSKIEFDDFLRFVIDRQGESRDIKEELAQGFKMFDVDDTGKITTQTLRKICQEIGESFTDQELRDMINEADQDGDNAVDVDEFTSIMLKTNLFNMPDLADQLNPSLMK
ncbi:Centrin-1 [Trichoplax sp. H2]|uniref:EF-hand domain-containing protein n=1 Tax=Trichoplax adhaerens TaxID=10228 RepID=B3RT33_TRIAD|nr:hypothetical protein TRIADDRAFT_54819 [Trichoplax adhaerens]EDV26621.1 hypothetical protein TRIADDRAFT_54819 [Trichoplax adhaerens]RDD45797.1 Centrin-1 [Trichoplax sp. H2]|eukprot:XP_002110617.1 hypothetical protein TRIADDRAFT_54819 [Trichoplax adhaerens]